jgi:DNA invertase Pin-like site-specific DNA recombinase
VAKKTRLPAIPRNVALCYVRQSYTRDANDMDSPERQRSNIQVLCETRGWIPEFYTDADGHKSAFYEDNRPGWLSLKQRIGDPDVTAIVANDANRIHRRLWRTGSLLELVEKNDVNLVFASPTSPVKEIKDPRDKFILQMYALMDENYVLDISRKQKDSIAYRKRLGKTVGIPPFGSVRNAEGYLQPSPYGAWVFPDGKAITGIIDEEIDGTQWRGYYDCAYRILSIFVSSNKGRDKIAYQMNDEGWRFKDQKGNPRPLDSDDIRRVTSNWAEYGGVVTALRAKDRPGYTIELDKLVFNPERTIFPIDLLRQVAETLHERSFAQPDNGVRPETHSYALAGVLYCYHCDEAAKKLENPKLRTRLGSVGYPREPHYRHREGRKCACKARSVLAVAIEGEVGRLLKLMMVNPEAVNRLVEAAAQKEDRDEILDLEQEKQYSIARCKEVMNRAKKLYLQAELSDEEYDQIRTENLEEIARWENRTQSITKRFLQMEKCAFMIESISEAWESGSEERRKEMVQSLFSEIVVDLDTRQITSFKFITWAEEFLVARATLLDLEKQENQPENGTGSTFQEQDTAMPPRGFEPLFWP